MKSSNPYESPANVEPLLLNADSDGGSRPVRLGILAFNTILLGLFPPTCCPCGLGPLGFILLPYMLVLGMPSIFLPFAFPQMRDGSESIFLSIYVTNYVLLSYGLGVYVDRLRKRRRKCD